MALVKSPLGGIAASGSVAGVTFARNRAGQYARAWAKPVNPATVRQTEVRSAFGVSSVGWGVLDQSGVDSWDAYAQQFIRLNRLGEEYTPKGRQMFMEINQNLSIIGQAQIAEPSAITDNPSMVDIGTIVGTETGGTLDALTIANIKYEVPSSGDGYAVIDATPPLDAKLTNVNNLYRQIAVAAGPQPIALTDVETAYIAVFGSAALAGQIINFRVRVVDEISGLGSSYLKAAIVLT